MSGAPQPTIVSKAVHAAESSAARLTFEQRAMALIVIILGIATLLCFVSLYPTGWAKEIGDRINTMRDSISYFVGLMATTLGMSWTRGHMDKRVDAASGSDGQ